MHRQKMSFSANWMTRWLPPVAALPVVIVIWPNVGLSVKAPLGAGTKSPLAGDWKFVWLMMSKNSARNSTRNVSETFGTAVSFSRAKSKFKNPGPSAVFLPKLPSSPTAGIVMFVGNAHHRLGFPRVLGRGFDPDLTFGRSK